MKTLILSLLASVLAPLGCETTPPPPPPAETWAFCGVHPDDPYAQMVEHRPFKSGCTGSSPVGGTHY